MASTRKPRGADRSEKDRLDYEKRKEDQRQRINEISAAGRDIGAPPPVENPTRRASTRFDFRLYCLTYHPNTFRLEFSQDHLRAIHKIERAVLHGDLFAYAMPRGSGKTSLAEASMLWALLHGHRRFGVLIGADADHAEMMLDSIKIELEANDALNSDFPEVCYPIRRLDGIAHRCKGQVCGGVRTRIEWGSDRVVFPCVPGSAVGGSCIRVAGITGRIRGMKHSLPDGTKIRPDYVVPDDPQTDESANSPSQVAKLERILHGAILNLAGPGCKIAGVMPCTVIRQGDLADRALDHKLHPEWFGERAKLLYAFPKRMDLWEQYRTLQAESFHAGRHGEEATAFYAKHRDAMDEGAVVGWAERFNDDELSAVQCAMNLWLRDEEAFWSEYQNEPRPPRLNDREELTSAQICEKVNRLERGVASVESTTLTAMIDVQGNSLWYAVLAWREEFGCNVIDYGVYPEQSRRVFQLRDVSPTLQEVTGIADLEASVYAGLTALSDQLLGGQYRNNGGSPMRVARCLIDAHWGQVTEVVHRFCRESTWSALLTPAFGVGITANKQPFAWWNPKPGERRGLNWMLPTPKPGRVRHLLYDTNYWKSFVHNRLALPPGSRGDWSLFGDKPTAHRLFGDHLTAETREEIEKNGRKGDEWKTKSHKPDNHWFDCVVGCTVAASMEGIALKSQEQPAKRRVIVKTAEQIREERARNAGRNYRSN